MDIMDSFENIRADLSGLQALAVMFTDAFATNKASLLLNIEARADTFINAAWLLSDMIAKIAKDMDAAIEASSN